MLAPTLPNNGLLVAQGPRPVEFAEIDDCDQKIKDLRIANLVCGLLLGAASASIAVTGAASAFPFVVVVISVGGIYGTVKAHERPHSFTIIHSVALLGAAFGSIIGGSTVVLAVIAVAISVAGLYASLSKTYKVAEERMDCIQKSQVRFIENDEVQSGTVSDLESSKGTAGRNELIKGVSYAFAGFVSGFAVTLLLGHFMAAKPAAAVEPEVRIQPILIRL